VSSNLTHAADPQYYHQIMTELREPAVPMGSSLAFGIGSALFALLAACHQDKDHDRQQDQRSRWDSATAVTHRQHTPLTVLPDNYAVCRLNRDDRVPPWATASTAGLSSISRTGDELSIVVVDSLAPRNVRCEREWRGFKVRGPLPLNLIGIIAGLSGTLANAGISIFALSTFETDYVMVKQINFGRAERAFRQAGYPIVDPLPRDSVQRLPVKPVDEAVTDPEFFLFRARVQTALATHDTAEIMRIVDPGILNSFGGDGGREEFRQQWGLENPEKSHLWATLGSVLALGGRFQEEESTFYAPYLVEGTTGDGFETLVVMGANVTVHSGPVSTSPVIDTVSFEEVTKWREKSSTREWEPIRTSKGRTGWVLGRHLRSPIAYRAGFVRRQGQWWLRTLVQGD
jgi:uncharacterized protein